MIGCRPYIPIATEYKKPLVVSGFEPLDVLQSVYMIMRQLADRRAEVENQYSRVVGWEGNTRAVGAIEETMELRPHFEWRGLGSIPWSAIKLRAVSRPTTPRKSSKSQASGWRTRGHANAVTC